MMATFQLCIKHDNMLQIVSAIHLSYFSTNMTDLKLCNRVSQNAEKVLFLSGMFQHFRPPIKCEMAAKGIKNAQPQTEQASEICTQSS